MEIAVFDRVAKILISECNNLYYSCKWYFICFRQKRDCNLNVYITYSHICD